MKTIIATIACANYLPKATFLASSLQAAQPSTWVVLCLLEPSAEAAAPYRHVFDEIVLAKDLGVERFETLVFRYSVLEASTAIKPWLLEHLFAKYRCADAVVFLDPDIWVFDEFPEIEPLFRQASIVVTPHHVADEETEAGIQDNMLRTLQCGTFNLGFLALHRTPTTAAFLVWWKRKLAEFCYVDFARGLFVDQKWMDLAISFFDVAVLRHAGYNIANWNISHRQISRDGAGYVVNAVDRVRFVHFSGIDTGRDNRIFLKYADDTNEIHWLRSQYKAGVRRLDRDGVSRVPWGYDYFASGERIASEARLAFRRNPMLSSSVADPFLLSNESFLEVGW